jgi:hypothetical protein
MGNPIRTIIGQTVRDDQETRMKLSDLEEGEVQPEKIVPVPCDESPVL